MDSQQDLGTKWLRTADALGAGAKIYGFRVDNVHMDTYKMISMLTRNRELLVDVARQMDDQDDEFSDGEVEQEAEENPQN